MGSSLGHASADIIMTELENVVVRNFIADETVAFVPVMSTIPCCW